MLTILGVDPGGTTGLVRCTLTDDQSLWVNYGTQIRGFNQQIAWIEEEAYSHSDLLVICERYVPRNTAFVGDAASALEPIGAIKYLSNQLQFDLVLPLPTERKAVAEKVMKEAGYWVEGEHARQALRHVLAYTVNKLKHQPTLHRLHPRK